MDPDLKILNPNMDLFTLVQNTFNPIRRPTLRTQFKVSVELTVWLCFLQLCLSPLVKSDLAPW